MLNPGYVLGEKTRRMGIGSLRKATRRLRRVFSALNERLPTVNARLNVGLCIRDMGPLGQTYCMSGSTKGCTTQLLAFVLAPFTYLPRMVHYHV